jgi:hypothetical protein
LTELAQAPPRFRRGGWGLSYFHPGERKMPQDQRYGRRYSRYDRDDERDYGRGRDDWRGESRSYRSSRYEDDGGWSGHDSRQDRDYQGTLRAGDYGRYEEEEDRTYPERYSGRGWSSEHGESDFGRGYRGGDYGRSYRGEYGTRGYGSGYGQQRGSYGSGYGQRDYGSSSRGYGSGGDSSYRGAGTGYGNYSQSGDYQGGGFGTYTQDYDRKYGSGSEFRRGYGNDQRTYGGRGRDWWDRATDEVSSWFGDEDAERRRRMDEHRGRGPKNYSRSDERIAKTSPIA